MLQICTAWKVSEYGVISGPYFPAFGLNTDFEIFGILLSIKLIGASLPTCEMVFLLKKDQISVETYLK